MRVRIKSETVISETRPDGQGGTFEALHQDAFLIGEEEVKKFRLRVASPAKGYKAGDYVLGSESLTVNKYGSLELGQVSLVPVPAGK